MKLTKLQRHTAYILMLAEVEYYERKGYDCFLCVIADQLFGLGSTYSKRLRESIPEFFRFEPKKNHLSGGWFFEKDYKSRKGILKQCIKETA